MLLYQTSICLSRVFLNSSEYQHKYYHGYRLMEHIYPQSIASCQRQRLAVCLIKKRRHLIFNSILSSISTGKKNEEPRQKREIIHRLKACRPEAERKKKPRIINKLRKLYSDPCGRSYITVHYSSCKDKKNGTDRNSDGSGDFKKIFISYRINHHRHTHKVQYAEEYRSSRREECKNKGDYHTNEEALDTAF